MKRLLKWGGIGLLGLMAVSPLIPDPKDQPVSRDCAPYGNLAASAWELAQRGITERAAVVAATSQVTDQRLLPLVRDAVNVGYQTRTQEGARHRAVTFCQHGNLGR